MGSFILRCDYILCLLLMLIHCFKSGRGQGFIMIRSFFHFIIECILNKVNVVFPKYCVLIGFVYLGWYQTNCYS